MTATDQGKAQLRPEGSIWAVTSYFNPAGYQRRLAGYRVFRRKLQTPLVTVELSYDTGFQLTATDAEILIQIQGRDVMFQKERPLNLAIDAVPAHVQAIAWLDCDIVFENQEWAQEALAALDHNTLVQPFDRFEEPDPNWSGDGGTPRLMNEARSWAWHYGHQTLPEERLSGDLRFRGCVTGGAWVARRELLAEHKLYDACIVGSGVRCPVAAGIGRPELAARYMCFTPAWNDHYMLWADPFHRAVRGRIGHFDGTVKHLWHGDLKLRRYAGIHPDFEPFDFDPDRDISVDRDGAYRWNSDKPEMHRFVRDYFFSRKEDSVAVELDEGSSAGSLAG